MNKEDWGFSYNETEEGLLAFPPGVGFIRHSLLLTKEESDVLGKLAKDMDLSIHSVLKQALRVLQMYRAGYLVDNSPKMGGCGACE